MALKASRPALQRLEGWLDEHEFIKGRVYQNTNGYIIEWRHANVTVLVQDTGDGGFEVYTPAYRGLDLDNTITAIAAAMT